MAIPTNKINKLKVRDKSCLLYKIQEKHSEHSKVSKCALLIGAGCSYPILPLGGGLIKLCQELTYIREVYPLAAIKLISEFFHKGDPKVLEKFISSQGNSKKQFQNFVSEKEIILKELINKEKENYLKKIPSSFINPNWRDFEKLIINDAKYSFWMDAYSNSPKERQRFIEALIDNKNSGGAYIILAMLIEMGYFHNILTTNFDDFINDALLNYTSSRPRFYADDELSQYISVYNGKPNIIKLHGDYRYANIKNTADETLRLSEKMEEKLKELLQNFDLIVIGYNGADYSIMNVLQQAKSPNCELLWCGMDENNVHWRVANLINSTENSWFVKTASFDDIIKDFYINFVQSPPDLIEKAKKRQDEIKDFILEYSKELQQDVFTTEEEKINLKSKDVLWQLFNKAHSEKNIFERIRICNEIIENDDSYVDAYNLKGNAFFELKKYHEALENYNKVIELDNNNYVYYYNRGNVFYYLDILDEGLSDLNKSIELNSTGAYSFNSRGCVFLKLKEYEKALSDFKTSIAFDQFLPNPHKHLGLLYFELENYESALKHLGLAIELDKDYIDAYELRAKIYRVTKEERKALEDEQMVGLLSSGKTI